MISNIIKNAANKENTQELKTFWLKKYTELTENNYFVLSPKTIELTEESEVVRPATPFGDLILMKHLDESGEINENLLQNNIEIAVRLLDACLDIIHFDKNSTKVVNQYRKIGLGIADFGQYFKNLKREVIEADEIEYIGNLVSNNAYRSSESLSEEKGICQNWDNIKKILRDKPFEYWYNTENGDIKTSSEMVANFDQSRVEASDFEIVPRRNSHLMLLPAIDQWQVWSDRSPMTINQLNEKSSEKSSTNSTNNLETFAINSGGKIQIEENKFDQNLISNDSPNDSQTTNSKPGGTIISFPKNKLVNKIQEINKESEKESQNNLQELKDLQVQNPQIPNPIPNPNSLDETESVKNEINPINSPNENILSNGFINENENLPKNQELEIQNSQNFFEKPNQQENNLEESEQKSQKELEKELENENIFGQETLQNNLNNWQDEEINSNEKEIDKMNSSEQNLEEDQPQNKDSLIKEMVSNFGQSKFVELSSEKQTSQKTDFENDSDQNENQQNNEEIYQENNQNNPFANEFQLGELVRIVKKDSPSFGQVQQIIEIKDNDLKEINLKLSGFDNQNQTFEAQEIEAIDLHNFLDQTNSTNQNLADGNSQNKDDNKFEKNRQLESEIDSLNQEKTQNLEKIQKLQTELEAKNLENKKLLQIEESQKDQINNLKAELETIRQELKNVTNSKIDLENENTKNFKKVNLVNLSSNFDTSNLTKDSQNLQPNNHAQELQNLLHQNPNLQPNSANKFTNNFFKLQNKFISFMSKYSLQLQQLASTNGQFKLGDILITLQYDGSGVKLVSASGDELSKELKHMVDTVLGIVNKALAFGVPAGELAKQMKLEPKDDATETALNHVLAVVAAALEEAPGQIQNLKEDSLFRIDKQDVETFTTTVKSDSMSLLMSKLKDLKSQGENSDKSKSSEFQVNSDQKFEPKENVKSEEKEENNTNPFAKSEENNQEENNQEDKVQTQNSQNNQPKNEESPKQEEKPRSFFGGFGGRN